MALEAGARKAEHVSEFCKLKKIDNGMGCEDCGAWARDRDPECEIAPLATTRQELDAALNDWRDNLQKALSGPQ